MMYRVSRKVLNKSTIAIFQLAQDIIFDLRQLLKQVRSTENQLRPQQGKLENTLRQALGKLTNIFFMTLIFYSYFFLDPSDPGRLLRLS